MSRRVRMLEVTRRRPDGTETTLRYCSAPAATSDVFLNGDAWCRQVGRAYPIVRMATPAELAAVAHLSWQERAALPYPGPALQAIEGRR